MSLVLLRRVHSVTGLLPLGAYLVFHAWEHWPVREGRDALFARLAHTQVVALELVFVLLPLLAHALLGLWLSRRPDDAHVYVSSAFRHLQAATGMLSLAFLLYHLWGAWWPGVMTVGPLALAAAHGGMRDQAGDVPGLTLHAIGIAAVCTHFGLGSGAALSRLFPRVLSPRLFRQLGIVAGVLLWLVFLDELASYATLARLL